MNRKDNHINPLNKLPLRSPNADAWTNIESALTNGTSSEPARTPYDKLPVHQPSETVWNSISVSLDRKEKTAAIIRYTLSTAALLLVFITVATLLIRNPEPVGTVSTVNIEKQLPQPVQSKATTNVVQSPIPVALSENKRLVSTNSVLPTEGKNKDTEIKAELTATEPSGNIPQADNNALVTLEGTKIQTEALAENRPVGRVDFAGTTGRKFVLVNTDFRPEKIVIPTKLSRPVSPSPAVPIPENKWRNPSIMVAYTPEPLDNGFDQTLMKNINMGISFSKSKFRFKTNVGYALVSEKLPGESNSTINSDATLAKVAALSNNFSYARESGSSSNQLRSIWIAQHAADAWNNIKALLPNNTYREMFDRAMVSDPALDTEFSYLLYNIGAGYQLFKTNKLELEFNTATMVALRTDKKSEREIMIRDLNKQLLATSGTAIPYNTYNQLNLSLQSGFAVNYKMVKRVGLSAEPLLRYYVRPLNTGYSENPDRFSFGIKTGVIINLY